MTLTPAYKSAIQLGTILALLASAATLAVTTPNAVTGTAVFGLVSLLSGATAVAGGLSISGSTLSTDLIPHTVLILSVLALTVALTIEKVWGGIEVTGVFSFIIGGGAVGAGSNIITTKIHSMRSRPVDTSSMAELDRFTK